MNKRHAARLLVLIVAWWVGESARSAGLTNAEEIDAFLDRAVAETHISGLVAVVVDRDRTLYERAVGQRSASGNVAMSADTIFNIASMTKPIATTAIMMLVEEGKLRLDEPISRYVPELTGKPVLDTFDFDDATFTTRPAASEITIRQRLSTSSAPPEGFSRSSSTCRTSGS